MKQKVRGLMTIALLALAFSSASAENYTPDVAEFDGTNALNFDASPQLAMAQGGTVEFWVVPDWTTDPGYDPTIISNMGPQGISYLVAMLRDRSGIAFAAGDMEYVATFDFTALNLPSDGVRIGSIDGTNNQFRGAIAGLRFWNVVVTQEELVEFALTDIFKGDHPNLDNLSAMSNFNSGELLLVQPEVQP